MKRYMAHILVSAEKITEHFLKVQVHDEGTLADGGMEGLVVDVKPIAYKRRIQIKSNRADNWNDPLIRTSGSWSED